VTPAPPETTLEWLTGVGTAAGAIAAAIAAWAAVWVGVLRVRKRRPALKLEPPEHGRELVIVGTPNGDSAWVRLSVSNASGKDAAEDVEVAIAEAKEVRRREGSPPAQQTPVLAGLALAWSATQQRQARAHVAPGAERMVDVAAVYKGSAAAGVGPLVIQTAFEHYDRARTQEVKSGEIELELVVTARNSDSARYRVRIAYDGGWGKDVWDHLAVTSLQGVG
jgi:hypothetical protein